MINGSNINNNTAVYYLIQYNCRK